MLVRLYRHSGWATAMASVIGLAACQPADTSGVAAASAAAHKAADQFTALAKGSETTGLPPRESDPAVAPLLEAIFNTGLVVGKPLPPQSDLDAANDWMLSTVKAGQVYLFAGSGTDNPSSAADPAIEAKAEVNVVKFAPEIGRYVDAELTLMNLVDSMLSADLAAHPDRTSNPATADGMTKVRAGTTTAVSSVIGMLALSGVTDDWRRARLPAILAIAPEATKLLPADQKAQLAKTALTIAGAVDDATVKAQLTAFATALGGPG